MTSDPLFWYSVATIGKYVSLVLLVVFLMDYVWEVLNEDERNE